MDFQEKRFLLAKKDPYHSITKTVLAHPSDKAYIGMKAVEQIPLSLIKKFESTNRYVLHTLDAHSWGGRAVDIRIQHPITGRMMSGSSSGTAVNVFCEINDLGIGTDGGGSVLAPAMSLNLFAYISPQIEEVHMKKYRKVSTDGISFTPSIGFMCRSYDELIDAIQVVYPLSKTSETPTVFVDKEDTTQYCFPTQKIAYPKRFQARKPLINFLNETLPQCDFLISKEGPIDLYGIGDTIFGSYGMECEKIQSNAKKGLLRVVNMVNATSICIPSTELSCGFVLVCERDDRKLNVMLAYGKKLIQKRNEIVTRYFHNLDIYDE